MLRPILSNLLSNAVKYSPEGSPVTVTLERNNDEATFTVKDHGPGLREEDLPKIFASFHRGMGTEGIPGTGLGLAIAKRSIESLSGNIVARNAPDGGAEFVVTLPRFFSVS